MKNINQNLFSLGYKIVTIESIGKMVQARKHRKKRVNKKWRKRYGFRSVPDGDKIIICHETMKIFMHPMTFKKLKNAIELNINDVRG